MIECTHQKCVSSHPPTLTRFFGVITALERSGKDEKGEEDEKGFCFSGEERRGEMMGMCRFAGEATLFFGA